jgi:hypothetical protein
MPDLAVMVEAGDLPEASIQGFVFGTDGAGAGNLIVHHSACKKEYAQQDYFVIIQVKCDLLTFCIWMALKFCSSLWEECLLCVAQSLKKRDWIGMQ